MRSKSRIESAFTLIELLVVISIIALLIAILMPSLGAARQEGQRAKCHANERQFGQYGQMNAHQDFFGRLHTPHRQYYAAGTATPPPVQDDPANMGFTIVGDKWMGDGDHDWGGANGKDASPSADFVASAPGATHRGANGRFMNHLIFGAEINGNEDFSLFKCTGDEGMISALGNIPAPTAQYAQSVFVQTGNSYMGDYFWFKSHSIPHPGYELRRFGAFRRPADGTVLQFQSALKRGGADVFIHKSRGRDVLGACGQLGNVRPLRGEPALTQIESHC